VIELREGLSSRRRRWSLAHELGHTLFYRKDSVAGLCHSIGILEKAELNSEEQLCNRFSRALLIPRSALSEQNLSSSDDPSFLLAGITAAAARFDVTVSALLDRISDVRLRTRPYLVVHMQFRENRVTKNEPLLRVVNSYSLGDAANRLYVWRNRSVSRIGLASVAALFDSWRLRLALSTGADHGPSCYVWSSRTGLRRAGPAFADQFTEDIQVTAHEPESNLWRRADLSVRTASCLFARRAAKEREAHVLSVLVPSSTTWFST